MTTLKNDYIRTMNAIESMETGINAHRDRFYDFINSGQAEGFADYCLSALSTTVSITIVFYSNFMEVESSRGSLQLPLTAVLLGDNPQRAWKTSSK